MRTSWYCLILNWCSLIRKVMMPDSKVLILIVCWSRPLIFQVRLTSLIVLHIIRSIWWNCVFLILFLTDRNKYSPTITRWLMICGSISYAWKYSSVIWHKLHIKCCSRLSLVSVSYPLRCKRVCISTSINMTPVAWIKGCRASSWGKGASISLKVLLCRGHDSLLKRWPVVVSLLWGRCTSDSAPRWARRKITYHPIREDLFYLRN